MMHRSIKQHLVRNAKFTCFSKNRKNKKHTHNNNNKPQKPKNKTKHKKPWGLEQKKSYYNLNRVFHLPNQDNTLLLLFTR